MQAVFFAIATVFGVSAFWYKDVQGPKHNPASLAITPSIEAIGRRGNDVLVRLSVHLQNESSSRVYVPLFWYTVHGHCFEGRELGLRAFVRTTDSILNSAEPQTLSARYMAPDSGEVAASGLLWANKAVYFDPQADRQMEELFLVPAARFDALRVRVDYFLVKNVEEFDPRWRVLDTGAVHGEVWLRRPSAADTAGAEKFDRTRHAGWKQRRGATWGWSHASLALWPQAQESRAGVARAASAGTQCAAASAPQPGSERMAMRR